MLFSREDVASYLTQNFEPAWEMVRPVPIVRIDFGNGTVSTRTLHGNVASYVCAGDGGIVDIVPGIYTPAAYTTALTQPANLAGSIRSLSAAEKVGALRTYHQTAAQRVRALVAARRRAEVDPTRILRDVGKGRIERPVEQFTSPAEIFAQINNAPRPRTAAELANWAPLVEDTRVNETQRRLAIHERLVTGESMQPEQIKRWLYRDVLHADIDDPYLGLGNDFFTGIEE